MDSILGWPIISHFPFAFSQFFKKHIPQMVQAFSQLQQIDQGLARTVSPVQFVQVVAPDQKYANAPGAGLDPDAAKIAAAA
jgi:hypothetical protein